jgi:hypothetical protein
MLGDLSLQDLSRKLGEARSRLRHYDCAEADQRLIQWGEKRKQMAAKTRSRKPTLHNSRSVMVQSYDAEQCISPPHIRGSLAAFDSPGF